MFFGEKSHGKSNKKPLFILISPLYGFDEPSFKKLYHECIEGNCVNGTGTMIYYSTQKYVGEFKDGKRYGQGTLYLPLDRTLRGMCAMMRLSKERQPYPMAPGIPGPGNLDTDKVKGN